MNFNFFIKIFCEARGRIGQSSLGAALRQMVSRKISVGVLFLFFPFFVNASVVINEVAWMGTTNSASDEWIELFSTTAESLDGWTVSTSDGGMNITLTGSISGGGYHLIERTDDTTVPNIPADFITPFGNGLSNTGEVLVLKNGSGVVIDTVDAGAGWLAGDNTTKETMQKSGSGWITAPGTPKAVNAASIPESSGGNETEENAPAESNEEELPQDSKSGLIDKKQFRADAGGDTVAIVGVEKLFEGKGYDLDGKLLMSGDFLWNFGDGASARGRNVNHIFLYPGKYRVVLDVSSGIYNASDTILVDVIMPALSLSEIKPGVEGFAELRNNSAYELDISYWAIGNESLAYYFPQDTYILPHAYVVIPFSVSHIEFSSFGKATLYYPNTAVADSFSYGAEARSDESFHNKDGVGRLGIASPGSEKFVARVVPSAAPNYESGSTNYDTHAATKESEVIKDDATEETYEETEYTDRQAASLASSGKSFYHQRWFWFAIIFVFALVSACAVFLQKRHSS